ncbi:unnamed protein product [Gordionus sp. m RMFG-2023]|uniref:cytochrome P450 3A13-like n=1 Tax=Gordionus sp. m RMFG-2023 TaxID=3053472 RepID=UPI0030E26C09
MFNILDSLDINYLSLIFTLILASLIIYGLIPVIKLFRCGHKHPFPLPFLGTIIWAYINGIQKCQIDWNRKYGQFYALAQGQTFVLVVSNPNYLKDILVKSFSNFSNRRFFEMPNKFFRKSLFVIKDEEWSMSRKFILPTFTCHKMKFNMFPLLSKCASKMVYHLKNSINGDLNSIHSNKNCDGKETTIVQTKDIFGCYAMDVIASTSFGLDIDSRKENNHAFVRNVRKAFDFDITTPILALIAIFPFIIPVLNYFEISFIKEASMQFFADIVESTIEERKKFNIKRNDYLQLFMDTHDNLNQSNTNSNNNGCKKNIHKVSDDMLTMKEEDSIETKKLEQNLLTTKEEYISMALMFFVAGYESPSNALCWIARTLAGHPEIQETLRQEIKRKINQKYRSFSPDLLNYDDIMSLKYMDQVIKEVLRLHPPAIFFDRVASEDYYLEDKLIKKGTVIEVPVYALHRDGNIWAFPDKFDPDRFDLKDTTMEDRYCYMPFGMGPRNCIGSRFAMLEMKVGLTLILGSNIQFVLAPGDINSDLNHDNTKFSNNLINFPKNGIKVGIRYMENNDL